MAMVITTVGVYPRVCGGTFYRYCTRLPLPGLSPRVRGNQCECECLIPRAGSIPACAGEPIDDEGRHCFCGVYPRVCGGTTA